MSSDLRPALEPIGLARLLGKMPSSRYLEYGCGGSTILASSSEASVSVDSSLEWIERVRPQAPKTNLLFADIGKVGAWGKPLRPMHGGGYAAMPWAYYDKLGTKPTLVLIDGRYRVACFCVSYILAEAGTTILFDDFQRPEYLDTSKILLGRKWGRLAEFEVPAIRDVPLALETLARHATDSR